MLRGASLFSAPSFPPRRSFSRDGGCTPPFLLPLRCPDGLAARPGFGVAAGRDPVGCRVMDDTDERLEEQMQQLRQQQHMGFLSYA